MANILLTYAVPEEKMMQLKSIAGSNPIKTILSKDITREDILWADVILGNPPRGDLHENDHLGLVALNSAGSTEYCEEGVLPENTVLTNATGAYGIIISEWLMGMLLKIMNRFDRYRDQQKAHLWQRLSEQRFSVYGSKVLILGTGNIGTEFAKRMKAMGAVTIGIRRVASKPKEFFDEIRSMDDLNDLLPKVDIVVNCLPGTAATTKVIGAKQLSLMKDDAVLLNIGRGSAVDTDALVAELEKGRFLGVGLDVTDPEPLPEDHRLWDFENVHITPHCSGGMNSPISFNFILEVAMDNLKAYLEGGEYRNVVDRTTGYKKTE